MELPQRGLNPRQRRAVLRALAVILLEYSDPMTATLVLEALQTTLELRNSKKNGDF